MTCISMKKILSYTSFQVLYEFIYKTSCCAMLLVHLCIVFWVSFQFSIVLSVGGLFEDEVMK